MSQVSAGVLNTYFTGSPGFTNNTINVVGDKVVFVFRLNEDAVITTVGVRQNTRANTTGSSPAGYTGTVRVGIQTVSTTTGLNSGTWVGGASNYVDGSSWVSANDGTFVQHTLPSTASLSRGVPYAVVAELVTAAASGSVQLSLTYTNQSINAGFPYVFDETTTTITKASNQAYGPWMIRSSTKTYGSPVESWTTTSIESDTTPNEIGLGFTIPSGFGTSYTIEGAFVSGHFNTTVDVTVDMTLYQGTTALQSTTIDTAQIANFNTSRRYELPFDSTTLSSLTPGTEYILAIKANDATTANAFAVREITIPASGDKSAFGDLGFKYYSRAGGSWTENTTRLPVFGIYVGTVSTTAGIAANPLAGYIL